MSPACHNQLCYLVSGGVVFDWVLCCQTDAAEQDEEEDEVGEDVVVDDLVARNPESAKTEVDQRSRKSRQHTGQVCAAVR